MASEWRTESGEQYGYDLLQNPSAVNPMLKDDLIFHLFLCFISALIFGMSLVNLLDAQKEQTSKSASSSGSSGSALPHAEEVITISYICVVVFGLALAISLMFCGQSAFTLIREIGSKASRLQFHHGVLFLVVMAIAAMLLSYGVITYQYNENNKLTAYNNTDVPSDGPSGVSGMCPSGPSCNVAFINSMVFISISGLVLLLQLLFGAYYLYSVKTNPGNMYLRR